MSGASAEQYHPGLEGVIASETAIANIEGKDGAGGLEYRGYRIEDLAGHVSYEETAFLLLARRSAQPRASSSEFDARLRQSRPIPPPLIRAPGTDSRSIHPMDVLRSSVSVLSHFDPDVNAPPTDHAANVRKAERMVAQMATAVAYRERIIQGLPLIPPRATISIMPANFLNMVNGKVPSPTMREAFDLSLVLYTEHELNASTFAARVTVSTLSDIYSGIVAAIGTLKGPLHGGANEEAWKVLERVGAPENAERWIQDALARKERIMGFGHRVYKTGDPRAAILKQYCIDLAQEVGDDRWERIAEPIERGRDHAEAAAAQRRLAQCPALSLHGLADRPLHADLRHGPGRRLGCPHHRATRPQPADAAAGPLYRPTAPAGQADRRAMKAIADAPRDHWRVPPGGSHATARASIDAIQALTWVPNRRASSASSVSALLPSSWLWVCGSSLVLRRSFPRLWLRFCGGLGGRRGQSRRPVRAPHGGGVDGFGRPSTGLFMS